MSGQVFAPYVADLAGPDYPQVAAENLSAFRASWRELGLSNPFATYERLVSGLAAMDHLELRSLNRFLQPSRGKVVVGLRHDVDIDHKTALRCARCLARHGVPGTFFFLHTAYYWGRREGGQMRRNPELSALLRHMAVTGCEVGLHIDPLLLYREGVDGAQAVVEELAWLRSLGLHVSGVAAHNSGPVYGAENFEVFKGFSIAGRTEFSMSGRDVPLQTLDMGEFGIDYEAHFPRSRQDLDERARDYLSLNPPNAAVANQAWMRTYLHDNPCYEREHEVIFWIIGQDAWVLSDRVENEFAWKLNTADVLDRVSRLSSRTHPRVLFVLHPCYFNLEKEILPESRCGYERVEDADATQERIAAVERRLRDKATSIEGLAGRISWLERHLQECKVTGRDIETLREENATMRRMLKEYDAILGFLVQEVQGLHRWLKLPRKALSLFKRAFGR
jgi:peptidoglycan/xylan/chitin deacetylase (PgdA/CDA1 family)